MAYDLSNQALAGRTILVSPNESAGQLATKPGQLGAQVLTWPALSAGEPASFQTIDEAIENLFGYDWLIFQNVNAARFFLERFRKLGHEISELDGLRICGVGEEAVRRLEAAHVHIDVIPERLSTRSTFAALETYLGDREAVRGLTFLVPSASKSRPHLQDALENAGGRVDLPATYRTSAANDLARTSALVAGGGIDCIVFTNASEARELAAVFDTNDLNLLLSGVPVACIDEITAQSITEFDLSAEIVTTESGSLARAIASHFHV